MEEPNKPLAPASGACGQAPRTLDGRVMRMRPLPNGWTYLLTRQQLADHRDQVGPRRLMLEALGARREWAPRLLPDLRSAGHIVGRPLEGAWRYRLRLWAMRESEFSGTLDDARNAVSDGVATYIADTEAMPADSATDSRETLFFFRRHEDRFDPAFSTKRLVGDDLARLDREFERVYGRLPTRRR